MHFFARARTGIPYFADQWCWQALMAGAAPAVLVRHRVAVVPHQAVLVCVSPSRIVTQIQCASQGGAGLLSVAFFKELFAHAG